MWGENRICDHISVLLKFDTFPFIVMVDTWLPNHFFIIQSSKKMHDLQHFLISIEVQLCNEILLFLFFVSYSFKEQIQVLKPEELESIIPICKKNLAEDVILSISQS